ncbi:hypothetical protein WK13_10350 [Burkholderia ubonensis]|nr:hypothetical protein WK13_10350 [Burkholderia ubonensis]
MSPIETFEQERQLGSCQRDHAGISTRPRETPLLKTLREQAETAVAPPQALQQVTALAAEHEHVSRERIFFSSTVCTFAANELNPHRISVTPAAIQILVF